MTAGNAIPNSKRGSSTTHHESESSASGDCFSPCARHAADALDRQERLRALPTCIACLGAGRSPLSAMPFRSGLHADIAAQHLLGIGVQASYALPVGSALRRYAAPFNLRSCEGKRLRSSAGRRQTSSRSRPVGLENPVQRSVSRPPLVGRRPDEILDFRTGGRQPLWFGTFNWQAVEVESLPAARGERGLNRSASIIVGLKGAPQDLFGHEVNVVRETVADHGNHPS